jgi:hypothetical protein
MINELEMMGKNSVFTKFEVPSWHLPKWAENHVKPQDNRCPGRGQNQAPHEYIVLITEGRYILLGMHPVVLFYINFFALFLSQHNNYEKLIYISPCNNKFIGPTV